MNAKTFARLLAKKINDRGDAVHAVAQPSPRGGWRVVDISADIIIPSATCIDVLYDKIHWLRSQIEYRVGNVDVFQAVGRHDDNPVEFYVEPNGYIE